MYRGGNKRLFILLSSAQAGPSKTVKLEQEEISRNHVQTFIFLSVFGGQILNKAKWRQMRQTKLRFELEPEPDTSSADNHCGRNQLNLMFLPSSLSKELIDLWEVLTTSAARLPH